MLSRSPVRLLLSFVAVFLSLPAAAEAQGELRARTVVDGLEFPAGIAFSSDGTMFVTERVGRIRVVEDGRLMEEPLAEIPTTTSGETGLLGITVSPDDRFVYAFATSPDGATNRVLRVPVRGGRPEVVVEGLPASVYHNGGGLAFDGSGMLLVSNGEQHEDDKAQDPDILGGKVYRFTPRGGIPDDNPFGNSPTFALGLRNPYGLTVDPVSGDAFVTENGPQSFDELNHILPGRNYGWPVISGPAQDPSQARGLTGTYKEPLLAYEDIVVPTGLAFASPGQARPGFEGNLFFATYGEQAIHRVELDRSRDRALSDDVFLRSSEALVALEWGPEGLYYSTPGAVRVIPLAEPKPRRAGGDDGEGRPSPEQRRPSPEPTVATEPSEPGNGGIIAAVVSAVVLAALALTFAIRRTRR